MLAGALALVLLVLAAAAPVPLVALGPGPTFDTLGSANGAPVVEISGLPTYPTSGHLNMTTVSVTDDITLFQALGFWGSPAYQVLPRSTIYPPGKSSQQVEQQNADDFTRSEIDAESAAVREIGLPAVPVVADVVAGSAADGVLALGDRITAIDGRAVTSPAEVTDFFRASKAGDRVDLAVLRGDATKDVQVTLRPSQDGTHGELGIVVGGLPKTGTFHIGLTGVGGPSAGLMFALALVDKLTPGQLAGDRFVAGTGEIDTVGNVSKIGGIQFKMRAAREAGATVFLVPDGNCADAAAVRPDGLQLVRVATLNDAVTALDDLAARRTPATCG